MYLPFEDRGMLAARRMSSSIVSDIHSFRLVECRDAALVVRYQKMNDKSTTTGFLSAVWCESLRRCYFCTAANLVGGSS